MLQIQIRLTGWLSVFVCVAAMCWLILSPYIPRSGEAEKAFVENMLASRMERHHGTDQAAAPDGEGALALPTYEDAAIIIK